MKLTMPKNSQPESRPSQGELKKDRSQVTNTETARPSVSCFFWMTNSLCLSPVPLLVTGWAGGWADQPLNQLISS